MNLSHFTQLTYLFRGFKEVKTNNSTAETLRSQFIIFHLAGSNKSWNPLTLHSHCKFKFYQLLYHQKMWLICYILNNVTFRFPLDSILCTSAIPRVLKCSFGILIWIFIVWRTLKECTLKNLFFGKLSMSIFSSGIN